MLENQLVEAGFYPISWPDTAEQPTSGTTYVRPGRRGLVRVFLCAASAQVEVYAGALQAGRLVYRGPAETAARLPLLAEQAN